MSILCMASSDWRRHSAFALKNLIEFAAFADGVGMGGNHAFPVFCGCDYNFTSSKITQRELF